MLEKTDVNLSEGADSRPKPLGTTDNPSNIHSSFSILIVEDHEANIQTYSEYLLAQGYRVFVARDGLEGLELAQTRRPDLILMDLIMPRMDGFEATRRIKADENLKCIPIIALTALVMPGDRERCLEAGVDFYLAKPVLLKELLNLIEKSLPYPRQVNFK